MQYYPIGVFDSGIGGLGVLAHCLAEMPHERFIYLADTKNMPYGEKNDAQIKDAAISCSRFLADNGCKAIAVACNTATEIAIDSIRSEFKNMVVVGLEPAIKPCLRELGRGYAVALVTRATARSDKFRNLIDASGGKIAVAPQNDLASTIERNYSDTEKLYAEICGILDGYRDAEAVILGCSHYTFAGGLIKRFYNGRIKIYDGAEGEAKRLDYCLGLAGLRAPATQVGAVEFYRHR